MPAARTAGYMVQSVREYLMEFGTSPLRDGFSGDAETTGVINILRAINRNAAYIAEETGYCKATTSINSVAGTAAYDLAATILSIQSVRYEGAPLEWVPGGEEQLQQDFPAYGTSSPATGTPMYVAQRDARVIVLYPVPDTSMTNNISVLHTAVEDDLVNPDDTFARMPVTWGELLPILAAYEIALMDPENPAMLRRAELLSPLAQDAAQRMGAHSRYRSLEQRHALLARQLGTAVPAVTANVPDVKEG